MAAPTRPTAADLFLRENWILIDTAADLSAITVAEATAASSFDVTRVVFASTGTPSQTTNRVRGEPRFGDATSPERIGTTDLTGGDMLYAVQDQAVAASDGKKLFEKIPAGSSKVLLNRRDVPQDTAITAGQFIHAFRVQFGPSFPARAGEGESAEGAMTVAFAVSEAEIMVAVAI